VADIAIVIVTYNSASVIDACLASLREHLDDRVDVIVADNASRDGTVALIEREHPRVRVLRRVANGGLSAAVNDGVRASEGAYVMALNPDTRLTSDAVTPLAQYLQEHADVGVVAPKLLDDDGTLQLSCRRFPGYGTAFFGRYALLTRLLPRNRWSRDYLMQDYDHAGVRDVDWVSGAAMMFPRATFDRLGGWDAGFFMFNEDVDFCRRVRDVGLRVVYYPDAALYHTIGVSRRAPARIIIERHKSMWRYYRKHMRGNVVMDAVTAAGIAVRCAASLAARGLSALRSA
jgi:GT2 family glycosyltransferase